MDVAPNPNGSGPPLLSVRAYAARRRSVRVLVAALLGEMDSPTDKDEQDSRRDRPHNTQHEQVYGAEVGFRPAGQSFHGHKGQHIDHGLSVASSGFF